MFDSDQNRYNNMQNRYAGDPQRRASRMATGSLSSAIISLFCIMTGFFAIALGSLAILLSFLSKGKKDKLERPALFGRVIGIIAALLGAFMIVYSFGYAISRYGSIENFYNSYIESLDDSYEVDTGGAEPL